LLRLDAVAPEILVSENDAREPLLLELRRIARQVCHHRTAR
jgi:hypothetical protein